MSNYFSEFPVVDYKFGNESTFTRFQHLGTMVDILDQVKRYEVYYRQYHIQNGERPEQLSYKLYGNVNYYWTFYLLNDHIRQGGWPIRDADVWTKAQQYYPNTVITTHGTTQQKSPKLFDDGNKVTIQWLPTETRTPLSKSEFVRPGNWIYFEYSKKVGQILKVDQKMGMVWTDVKDIRGIDKVFDIIPEDEAEIVIGSGGDYVPSTRYEEVQMHKVYDEFDAPHHYENADGDWVWPEYSATYPYPMDQRSVNSVNSVSYYQRLAETNESQKSIAVIKGDVIERIASELSRLLKAY